MKKKVCIFTMGFDEQNDKYADMFINSLKKFHPDVPVIKYNFDMLKKMGATEDDWRYKLTPFVMKELIKEYELVIRADADEIVLGDLDYVFNSAYDVGTVINFNRVDPFRYGFIDAFKIPYNVYFNNGFVAVRNEKFISEWWRLCNITNFVTRFQFHEQDMLNLLCHYFDYKVRCFDMVTPEKPQNAWYGLISKGEWWKAKINEKREIYLPKCPDGWPTTDVFLKVIHWGGGGNEPKMNYYNWFPKEVADRIDWLVKDERATK